MTLIENAGRLLVKEELMQKIWQDRFVEESNLTFNIKMLRKALGDSASEPIFIETVQRRGYRFIAEVREISEKAKTKNNLTQKVSETNKNTFLQTFGKSYLPIAALVVLLISSLAIASWYVQSRRFGDELNAPISSSAFSSEKLTNTGKVIHAVLSSDGEFVAYTSEVNQKLSVWLRELETANNIQIIPPSDSFYGGLALSHDNKFLYFTRKSRDKEGQLDIYRVSIFGGVPTKIINETQGWISLSPDDGQISFVRCYYKDDDYCSLFSADTDGNNERKLVTNPQPIRIADNQFSPDGKTIAFAAGQSENGANEFGLSEIDVESGVQREITARKFFNIKQLKWLPNQSGLLLTTRENIDGVFRIWQVSAENGEAQIISKDAASYLALSLDKDATKLITTQFNGDFRLYLSPTDNPTDSKILSEASDGVTFTPDGKLVFASLSAGNTDIWTMNTDGTDQRQLTNNAASDFAPLVSPDGRFIFFTSNRSGSSQVWRMDSDGSNQTQITQQEGGYPLFASLDGKWLYYKSVLQNNLWKVSVDGGDETLFFDKKHQSFAISPDDSQIAFFDKQDEEKNLTVVSMETKQTIKTFSRGDNQANPSNLKWFADGKTLAYILVSDNSKNTLWMQSLDAEKPQQFADLGNEEIMDFATSPNNKDFAIIHGQWNHDAVLIKGLK